MVLTSQASTCHYNAQKQHSQDYHTTPHFPVAYFCSVLASVIILDSWPNENWVIIGFISQFLLHHLGKSRYRTQSMSLKEKTSPNAKHLFTFRLTFSDNSFILQDGLYWLIPSTSTSCQQNAQNTCPQANPMEVIFQISFSLPFMFSWQTRFCHQIHLADIILIHCNTESFPLSFCTVRCFFWVR